MRSKPAIKLTTRTGGRPATRGLIEGQYALSVGMPSTPAPAGWRWTPLSDVARLESGHTPSRKKPEYWGGDIPWIGIRDATGNHGCVLFDTEQHTNGLGIANSSARLLPAHTVCLSRTASVGYVVAMGRPMATSQDFVNWVCGEHIDWRFLKYVLLAEHESYSRFAHGTTHQTIYFPEVKAFHVCLPPIAEQRRIAGVLGALDDKIESNLRLVHSLRRAAVGLFEDCSGEPTAVGEIATLEKGLSYKGSGLNSEGLPLFNLANFTTNGWLTRDGLKYYTGAFRPRHVVSSGDLLIANTDLTQRRAILGQPLLVPAGFECALFTHHVFVVRLIPGNEHLRLALYFAFQSSEFRGRAESFGTGTTVAALPRDAVLDFEFRAPGGDELEKFDRSASALIERAWAAEDESHRLSALRDTLLPKLVSGEIRVPESYEPPAEAAA